MKRLSIIKGSGLLAVLCLVSACASKPSTKAPAGRLLIGGQSIDALIPAAERNRIDTTFQPGYRGSILIAQAMGAEIAWRQRLAVDASNVYMARPGDRRTKLAGWLVVRRDGAAEVLFIAEHDHRADVVAVARSTGPTSKPSLHTLASPRALDNGEKALWKARKLAFTAKIAPCSSRYHPVVIPVVAAGKKQLYVYLLPLAPAGTMMLGGYYRIKINADGTKILDTHRYTRSCLRMHGNPKAVGIAVTENESPTPTPPQVYANLRYGLPIYVTTSKNDRQWEIQKGRITPLKKPVNP